jgi:hypothetical protein
MVMAGGNFEGVCFFVSLRGMFFFLGKVGMMDALFLSPIIRTILIVSITDVLVFRVLMKHRDLLTPLFVFEVIVVTIVPLVISFWFDIIYRKMV